jgi:hypothetical protein
LGITYAPSKKVVIAIRPAEIMYGRSKRLKLIPVLFIAIISELSANFVVKKITEMKTNKGLKRLVK